MDIIEFLQKDHDALRADLTQIGKNLDKKCIPELIRDFILHLERHESIEEEILYPKLDAQTAAPMDNHDQLFDYESDHTELWGKIEQFRELCEISHFCPMQKAFFDFDAFAEAHMRCEERILFPAARRLLSQGALDEMGAKAEEFGRTHLAGGGTVAA